MELLILCLLAPSVILAQKYHGRSQSSPSNPNDEPFLPIYPLYPYSPKLIKRGAEREVLTHLTPELYAPKVDARDSYTASFSGNYQRDPYYPSYNPYPKTSATSSFPTSTSVPNAAYTAAASYPSTASFAAPNAAYSSANPTYTSANQGYSTPNTYTPFTAGSYSNPYQYSPSPYGIYNSYSTPYAGAPNPYQSNPYATGAYPNYNYQAPYYYPNYYNQPYPHLPPPPPPHSNQEDSSDDSSEENETSGKSSGGKKSESRKNKYKEDSDNGNDSKDEQFIDGANFLSSGSKDLDGQPSTYKTPSQYNQLEQVSDVHLRSLPTSGMPRTTYRVISVGGQPVGSDYPIPATYAKVQQLEQLMSQTLAKLLAQNAANQAGLAQFQYQNNQQTDSSGGSYGGQGIPKQPQTVIAKTGLAYVMNPTNLGKTNNNNAGQFFNTFGNRQNPVVIKVQEPSQGSTILSKAANKYTDGQYGQKAVTTVSLQQAPGIYIPPEAKTIKEDGSDQSAEYGDYESSSGQNYDGPIAPNGAYKKNEQNYSIDQGQGQHPYHGSNLVTVQTPQAQSYQYSSYLPTQSTQQQQPRDYKPTSLDDVNFNTKRNSKE